MIYDANNGAFENQLRGRAELSLFSSLGKSLMRNGDGYAVVSGSYALHVFLQATGQGSFTNAFGFTPNDIDIYLTLDSVTEVCRILGDFFRTHGNCHLESPRFLPTYTGMFQRARIRGIVEFFLVDVLARRRIKVQLIMLWSGYRASSMEVARSIIMHYDISAVKVAMAFPNKLTRFYFMDQEDFDDIQSHRFSLRLRHQEDFRRVIARCGKYLGRGFTLHKVWFEDLGYLSHREWGIGLAVPSDSPIHRAGMEDLF